MRLEVGTGGGKEERGSDRDSGEVHGLWEKGKEKELYRVEEEEEEVGFVRKETGKKEL